MAFLKNIFLFFGTYLLTASVLAKLLHYGTDGNDFPIGIISGLIVSFFVTPVVIHVWNKLTKK